MALSTGDKLGPYEILTPLGAGGMGQVWKARDSRLNRFVAIKTSQQRFSERFEREALAIAALNHPHICSLYDVGPDYLVMEHVEGTPLHGPLPLDRALLYASQICDALDAAHRRGITHRDLKPANILLGQHGVKVLDFGLAKMDHAPTPEGATRTIHLTGEGAILGTLQYMSPEQLEGKEADARSDIFAFGLVLYELITGIRPFTGESQASLIASVLKEQPRPLHETQPLAPPGLDRVIQTCLEKNPEKRWQSARELKHGLEWMAQAAPVAAPRVEAPPKNLRLWQGAAALLVLVSAGLAGWIFWPRAEAPGHVIRFQAPLPGNVTFGQYVSLSPDSRKLVFNSAGAQDGLWIRDLEGLEWRRLPGTEEAISPFWSPDSRFLAFGSGSQLKKIDVAGGPAQTLCTVPNIVVGTGSWNRDGVIVFGGRGVGPLWKISQAGGVAAAISVLDTAQGAGFHSLPTFLPDGRHFLYLRAGASPESGIYAGSLDVKPERQSPERILTTRLAASYANGYLFYMRETTLMAQPFDAGRLALSGEPVPVAERVGIVGSIGIFSVSPGGALAYRGGTLTGSYQLTWFDRLGKVLGAFGQPSNDGQISLSPDGKRGVIRDAPATFRGDLWTVDFARSLRARFTFRQGAGSAAVWSPDGSRIAFAGGTNFDTLFEKASSGASDETELLKEPGSLHAPTNWSSDGRFLLYTIGNAPETGSDLWVLPFQGDRKPVPLLRTPFFERDASFSPNMRWITYASNESGRFEIYVRPFTASGPPGAPSLGQGKWQISRDGGYRPKWRGDGKEIVFHANASAASPKVAVEVKTSGAAFESGTPSQLPLPVGDNGWDVTADGKRFVLAAPLGRPAEQTPITVVLNWPALLKKK